MDIRILLADDHKLMREGLRTLIAEQPNMSVVAEAEDGTAAVQLAAKLSPDVVIMDISMPGLNGIEATREILDADPSAKVICLSMHLDRLMVLEMLKAGATGYLLKDCAFDEVISAIENVSSNSGYISPKAAELVVREYNSRIRLKAASIPPHFSKRERDVLQLLAEGRNAKETAAALRISVKAAEFQRQQIILNHMAPALGRAALGNEDSLNLPLTLREKEILVWVKEGKNNWEIASILGITLDTVKFHLKNIFQKLNVTNRSQAVSVALENRLLEP